MAIKCLMVDFGGVLGNQDQINFEILEDLLDYLDLTKEEFWRQAEDQYKLAQKGEANLNEVVAKANEKKVESAVKRILDSYREKLVINKEMLELLEQINQKNNVKIICASNTIREYYRINKQKEGYSHFEETYFSFSMNSRKPEKEFYQTIVKSEDFNKDEYLFIDDQEQNINAAKELGIESVLFEDIEGLKKDLEKYSIQLD